MTHRPFGYRTDFATALAFDADQFMKDNREQIWLSFAGLGR